LVLETLHRDSIGDHDAFMSLGMDSLMSISLCSQLEAAYGININYRNFWTHASVQRLTDLIQGTTDRRNKPLAKSLLTLHGNADAPTVLVCFHCAGGNPAMFFDWQQVLPPDMALLAIQVPGRGELYDEARPESVGQLIASIGPYFFERLNGKQFYFAGHSMGGILAYEMAQHLAKQYHIEASKLFILASIAPDAASAKTDFVHAAKDNMETLFPSYSLVMEQSIKDDLVALLLDDLGLLDDYRCLPDKAVPLNIISLRGQQDRVVNADDIAGWAKLALQYEQHTIDANHINILHAEAALTLIKQHLRHQ
jgi:surfactin synthase thioesterase subunit/acyl carrier protein